MDACLVAVFDTHDHAEAARQRLLALGVPAQRIHLRAPADDTRDDDARAPVQTSEGDLGQRVGFFARLFNLDLDDAGTGPYRSAFEGGRVALAVEAIEPQRIDAIAHVLAASGAVAVDDSEAGEVADAAADPTRKGAPSDRQATAAAATAAAAGTESARLPLPDAVLGTGWRGRVGVLKRREG